MLTETLPDELRHFKEENKVVLELSDLDVTLSYFCPQGRTTLLELKKNMEALNMLAFLITVLLVFLQGATALFEDQAGKFDWYFYLFLQYKIFF